MRPVQQKGSAPLSDKDKGKMLGEHIPYRVRLLVDAFPRLPARCDADNQAFEAGTVSGRILLSFLGLGSEKAYPKLKEDQHHSGKAETDDVKVSDVGGSFIDPDVLTEQESLTLAKFIHGANKACAHFTIDSGHELDFITYREAVPVTLKLLQKSLPSLMGGVLVEWAEKFEADLSLIRRNTELLKTLGVVANRPT